MRNGPSRSFNVVDFGSNRKHVCNFLLVINSNLGSIFPVSEIFQVFCIYWSNVYWLRTYAKKDLLWFLILEPSFTFKITTRPTILRSSDFAILHADLTAGWLMSLYLRNAFLFLQTHLKALCDIETGFFISSLFTDSLNWHKFVFQLMQQVTESAPTTCSITIQKLIPINRSQC